MKTQADIVFCIDATGSMGPCFEAVRASVLEFTDGLQSAADVDYRLRLIAYRDVHDLRCGTEWNVYDFTDSVEAFQQQLKSVSARGGGGGRGSPESALDALYIAITKSSWRPQQTHRSIILMTDEDTHPTLHKSTYSRPDNSVDRVIQEFQTMKNAMLFLIAPKYPIYQEIERAMESAERKIFAYLLPPGDERYVGLVNVPWSMLLKMIGQMVSKTTVAAALEDL